MDAGNGAEATRLRRELVAYLRRFGGADGDYGAAELVLGELLSNAGRYTPGPAHVTIDWSGVFPRVSVHDAGRGFAWAPRLPRGHAESGRGLYIVAALGRDVQVECTPGGCCVSVTLPVPRHAVAK